MVNVFRLLTVVLVGAGGKCRFPIPDTTTALESRFVTVAVMAGTAGPVFNRDALYVKYDCVRV
jgi:uncharacterized protein